MSKRDLNLTVFGFLFHSYFLYGLFQLLLGFVCIACIVFLFRSSEPLALRIFGCLVIVFAAGSAFHLGSKHILSAWKDWRTYIHEERNLH